MGGTHHDSEIGEGESSMKFPSPIQLLPTGTIICACSDTSDECVTLVREWLKTNEYTPEEVRVVKRDGQVLAELKSEVFLYQKPVKEMEFDRRG